MEAASGTLMFWFDLQCSVLVKTTRALHEPPADIAAPILSGSLWVQFQYPVVYLKHTLPNTRLPDIKRTCLLSDLCIKKINSA